MADLDAVLSQADSNLDNSLNRLCDLVRIKSISTDPDYADHCREAANWLADTLNGLGFDAGVRDTDGHPMVVGHHAGPEGALHVLFYGHYDVQPVDPLDLWTHDPFEPAVRELPPGRPVITGRGTSDDKGQLLQDFACGLHKDKVFNVVLTPNANKAHHNHFHFDITPNATWYILR